MAKLPGYCTIAETAKILGVCHSQAARYIREGHLPAVDLGGQKLVKREVVDKFEKPLRGNPNFRSQRKRKTG